MISISVIIPVWNAQDTIEATIRSALTQTVSPYEILVCDDGSTDNSEKIVSEINDKRVRWISGNRGGRPAIPRNIGIKESKGEWLAFLDSDDVWVPNKLEKQLIMLKKSKLEACATNAFRFIPKEGIKGEMLNVKTNQLAFKEIIKCNWIICSSTLIHKNLITDVVGFPEDAHLKALEDYCMWLRIACKGDFCYLQEPLVIYMDDIANSIRGKSINNYFQQKFSVINNLAEWGQRGNHITSINYFLIKKELYITKLRYFLTLRFGFIYNILRGIKKSLKEKGLL